VGRRYLVAQLLPASIAPERVVEEYMFWRRATDETIRIWLSKTLVAQKSDER